MLIINDAIIETVTYNNYLQNASAILFIGIYNDVDINFEISNYLMTTPFIVKSTLVLTLKYNYKCNSKVFISIIIKL